MQQSSQTKCIWKLVPENKFYLAANFSIIAIFVWVGIMAWIHWKTVAVMIKIILRLLGWRTASGDHFLIYYRGQ